MYDRIDDTEKKEKYSRSFQYKALIDYYHYFCFLNIFFVIYYLKCAHFFDTVRCKDTKFLIDTQIDLTKLCSNEINTKTCVQKYLLLFFNPL